MNETTTKKTKFKKDDADNARLPHIPGPASKDNHPIWGLALGSGGARGLAPIGIFKALEKAGLRPDVITGTSIGALVGGVYACRPDADELEKLFYHILNDDNGGNKPVKMINRLNWNEKDAPDLRDRFFRFLQREIFLGMARFRNGVCSLADFRHSMEQFLPDIDLGRAGTKPMRSFDRASGRSCGLDGLSKSPGSGPAGGNRRRKGAGRYL